MSDEWSEDSLKRLSRTPGLPSELLEKEIPNVIEGYNFYKVPEIPVPGFEEDFSSLSAKKKSKKSKLAMKRAGSEEFPC